MEPYLTRHEHWKHILPLRIHLGTHRPMNSDFDTFFSIATGHPPYPYQRRLAGDDAGRACESLLIDVPTGLGKTAAR